MTVRSQGDTRPRDVSDAPLRYVDTTEDQQRRAAVHLAGQVLRLLPDISPEDQQAELYMLLAALGLEGVPARRRRPRRSRG